MARKAKLETDDATLEEDAAPPDDAAVEGSIGSMRHGLFADSYYHGDAPEPEGPVFDPRYP